ncbi:MAG: hypothetical protein K1X89_01495 [Myxococcaceae bacterium]|nr:hypothetical protein [Myxococcaceae bacterium]
MRGLLAVLVLCAGCTCGPGNGHASGGGTAGSGGGSGSGGSGGAGGSGQTVTALDVTPKDKTYDVRGAPETQAYVAMATYANGTRKDVSADVQWSLADPRFGSFSGATFTSAVDLGGTTQVRAVLGTANASTSLTLVLHRTAEDTTAGALPADAGTLFGGPAASNLAPQLVYPNDQVLVPPNLGQLEFHFIPQAATSLYAVTFTSALTDVTVLTRCQKLGVGCVYLPAPEVWSWVANTNRGSTVQVQIKATDDQGTGVGTSAAITLQLSQDDIRGGLYYWTTSNGSAVMRFDFANPMQKTAQKWVGPDKANNNCLGCHALSRDGKKLIAESGGIGDGRLLLLDVEKQTAIVPYASGDKSIFESWGPDGSQFVGVYGDQGATDYNLMLFDGSNTKKVGSIAGTGDASHPANHPDWSADGKSIAYVKVGVKDVCQRFGRGSIQRVTALADGGWSAPEQVVADAAKTNRYYPAIAPTNDFLVYDESSCANSDYEKDCNADTDPTARLFAVQFGGSPVELAKLNAPGIRDGATKALTNSFPKWSPFVFQRTGELGSKLLWVTFSSSRAYGLREPPAGGSENPRGTLLWMAAVDPAKLAAGMDPSFAAFALPFQDLATSNHIAQWTTLVVGDPGIN